MDEDIKYDVFICHASEDKAEIARPLASQLEMLGLTVWYDEFVIKPGMSLSGSIDHGLSVARFGIVILSHAFFSKGWTKYELSGLKTRQINGENLMIPILSGLTIKELIAISPSLADIVFFEVGSKSIDQIGREIFYQINADEFSIWIADIIRFSIKNANKAIYNGPEVDYWPDGGLRNLYYRITNFATYSKFIKRCVHKVWLSGPHSDKFIDLNNRYDFGRYNPVFVLYLKNSLSLALESRSFLVATKKRFRKYFSNIVVSYYISGQMLNNNPNVTEALKSEYQRLCDNKTLPLHFYRRIAYRDEQDTDLNIKTLVHRLNAMIDPNIASQAVYFWLRRKIDGTDIIFMEILDNLFRSYHPSEKNNLDNFGIWSFEEPDEWNESRVSQIVEELEKFNNLTGFDFDIESLVLRGGFKKRSI